MAAKGNRKNDDGPVTVTGVSKTTGITCIFRQRTYERGDPRQGVCLYRTPGSCSRTAGADRMRTTQSLLMVPEHFIKLDLPFLRKCMGGICIMAEQRGYDLMLCYVCNTDIVQLQRQLANHKVDGVILTYTMADDPCIELLQQYETPFVLIGRSEDKTIPQADNDQVAAACEMTRILLQLGASGSRCWWAAPCTPSTPTAYAVICVDSRNLVCQ